MNLFINITRNINRGISVFISLFLLVMIFGDPIKPNLEEAGAMLLFPGGVILGFLWAWKNERIGSLISLVSLGLFYVYMYVSREGFPGGPYFVLLSFPAFIFLFLSFLSPQS